MSGEEQNQIITFLKESIDDLRNEMRERLVEVQGEIRALGEIKEDVAVMKVRTDGVCEQLATMKRESKEKKQYRLTVTQLTIAVGGVIVSAAVAIGLKLIFG